MLASKEISSVELTKAQLDNIDKLNPKLNSYLIVTHELALAQAREVDELRAKGEKLSALAGVPIAVKDNLTTIGIETTAGSKILKGWVPPYNATVVEKVLAHRMPILGKTNLDEFAMGSSTENSVHR
jgi:aspartyl-tRNA(Asn)/glutamyl-tRNA(Gln) amidotransferase subunit A